MKNSWKTASKLHEAERQVDCKQQAIATANEWLRSQIPDGE